MKFRTPDFPDLKEGYYFIFTMIAGIYSVIVAFMFPAAGKLLVEVGYFSLPSRAIALSLLLLGFVPLSLMLIFGLRSLLRKFQCRTDRLAIHDPQKQLRKERLFKATFCGWVCYMMLIPLLFLFVTIAIGLELITSASDAGKYAEKAAILQAAEDARNGDFRTLISEGDREPGNTNSRPYPVYSDADKKYVTAYNKEKIANFSDKQPSSKTKSN